MRIPRDDSTAFIADASANYGLTFIPVVVGCGIDCVLMGGIMSQFVWWRMSDGARHDHWLLKSLVVYLLVTSLVHTGISLAFESRLLATGYGNPALLLDGDWMKRVYLVALAISMPVEVFYSHRAWRLWKKSLWLLVPLACLLTANVVLGIIVQFKAPHNYLYVMNAPLSVAWLVCLVLLDVAVSILIMLALFRARTGFEHTDRLIIKLIVFSAEAQIIPSLVALGFVIKTLAFPTSTIVYLFICAPKVWVMSFMTVISSRSVLRDRVEAERQRRENTFDLGLSSSQPPLGNPEETFLAYLETGTITVPPNIQYSSASFEKARCEERGTPTIPELEIAYLREGS